MKIINIFLFGLIIFVVGCTLNDKTEFISCEGKSDEFCTAIYQPVCGENGINYSNSCEACKVVEKYKNGEC